jgi:hypothetical protein
MELIIALSGLFFISSALAAYFAFKYKNLLKQLKINPNYETQLILADLMSSSAHLQIKRIDSNYLIWQR